MAYTPWPSTGRSYDTALTIAIWLATAFPAVIGRCYVSLQRNQPKDLILLVLAAWIFFFGQSTLLIAACRLGLGSSLPMLPQSHIAKIEHILYANNILLVLSHGFSRSCMLLTVARVQHRRTLGTHLTFAVLAAWFFGSLLGVCLTRLAGPGFWRPVHQDLQFFLWLAVHLVGLVVDLAVSALGAHATVRLQMGVLRRVFLNIIFSADVIVIIPAAFGLQYLERHSVAIVEDTTLHSTPFLIANQIGLWASMWCRFLEISHSFRDEMGHATFGFGEKFSQVTSQRSVGYKTYWSSPKQKRPTFPSARRGWDEREEDEIELAAIPPPYVAHNATVESNKSQHEQWSEDGILQHKSYGVEVERNVV